VAIPPIKNLLTEDQLRQLIAPFKHYDRFSQYQGWVIANFILNTGARKSNLVNLKMCDLHRIDEGIVRFGTTKNGKPQLIFVPAETCAILKKWCGIWRSDAKPEDYVFCDTKGNQSTGYSIGARYMEFLEKNCEEGFPTSLHLLRHQYASMFLMNGGSIYDLKRQLGHSSFAMVQWYADHYTDPNISNMEAFTPSRTLRQNEKLKPKLGKKK
jgi:integrase/recombinase XerD